jgi:phage gpG-like protein
VGTSLVYAARHNFGWTESKPNTPARPFLGVGAELQGELADTVRDFLGDLP